jgi:hypothetical protein
LVGAHEHLDRTCEHVGCLTDALIRSHDEVWLERVVGELNVVLVGV